MAKVDIMNLLISYCPPFWHIGHHDPAEKTPVLVKLFQQKPFVTMTGPRQSGKTTLCRMAFPHLKYVNLEAPDQREFAESDPRGFLARLGTGVILDEIQRVPDSRLIFKCWPMRREGAAADFQQSGRLWGRRPSVPARRPRGAAGESAEGAPAFRRSRGELTRSRLTVKIPNGSSALPRKPSSSRAPLGLQISLPPSEIDLAFA